MDSWKLHRELVEIEDITWIINIMNYFSKFMISFAIDKNNGINALTDFKVFFIFVGVPKILKKDKGTEYKNCLFQDYYCNNNIKHFFSLPYHPQTFGVVEVNQKEIRKDLILHYSENPDNFDLKDLLLEAVYIHTNKIHTSTKYKPVELIHYTDDYIYNNVIENIKNTFPENKEELSDLNIRINVLIKKIVSKVIKDY